jgi:hypothetical protein
MKTAWSIDWFSCTFKHGEKELDIRHALNFGMPKKAWAGQQARFGYSFAMVHPFGHYVMSNPARDEMGVHVAFTGRSLKALADGGIPGVDMVKWALDQNASPTRLDLAIDVFDVKIDPAAMAALPRVKAAPGTARKWSTVKGHDDGCTAYIGSRKSEKFLRIYDKAAEQGIPGGLWTRFEIELKGKAAKAAAAQIWRMGDADRPAFIKGLIRDLFNPDDEMFQSIMDAPAVALVTEKDTRDTTLSWLMNTVSKSLAATMLRRGDIDVWGDFVRQVHANMVAAGAIEPVLD